MANIINTGAGITASYKARGFVDNANDGIDDGGYLVLSTSANAPFSDSFSTILTANGGTGARIQLAATTNKLAFRNFDGVSWSAWFEMYGANNITASPTAPTGYLGNNAQHQVY